jgi:serine/threonine-protein kinase HipA
VHWKLSEIKARHWDAVAHAAGVGSAGPLLQEIATETPRAIEKVSRQVPRGFPAVVQDKIFEGLQATITRF